MIVKSIGASGGRPWPRLRRTEIRSAKLCKVLRWLHHGRDSTLVALIIALEGVGLPRDHLLDRFPVAVVQVWVVFCKAGRSHNGSNKRTKKIRTHGPDGFSSGGHDRRVRAGIGIATILAGLLSCTDTGCRCHQSDCKNKTSDCANVHVELLASLLLTGLRLRCFPSRGTSSGYRPDVERRHAQRCSRDPLRSRRRGGQRILGTGVAVVDGNLEEPGAGHTTTGRRRSLVMLIPGCSA